MFSRVVCVVLFLSTYFVRGMEQCVHIKAFKLEKAASGGALVLSSNSCDIVIRCSEVEEAIKGSGADLIKFVADNIKKHFTSGKGANIKGKDVKIYGYTGKISDINGKKVELKERFPGGGSNNFDGEPFEEDEGDLLKGMLSNSIVNESDVINVYFYPVDPPKDKKPGSKKCCCC